MDETVTHKVIRYICSSLSIIAGIAPVVFGILLFYNWFDLGNYFGALLGEAIAGESGYASSSFPVVGQYIASVCFLFAPFSFIVVVCAISGFLCADFEIDKNDRIFTFILVSGVIAILGMIALLIWYYIFYYGQGQSWLIRNSIRNVLVSSLNWGYNLLFFLMPILVYGLVIVSLVLGLYFSSLGNDNETPRFAMVGILSSFSIMLVLLGLSIGLFLAATVFLIVLGVMAAVYVVMIVVSAIISPFVASKHYYTDETTGKTSTYHYNEITGNGYLDDDDRDSWK